MGLFSNFFKRVKYTFTRTDLDDDFYDELEMTLISSDMGANTALEIMDELKSKCKKALVKDSDSAMLILKDILIERLNIQKINFNYPLILTVIGVNGVGKTTTIAKLAKFFLNQKKTVMLAAGDTFRAGATEQLNNWAEKLNVKIIKQGEGADSASVAFDAITSFKSKNLDVLLIDTAGRLHTKVNLMKELEKISNVSQKVFEQANRINIMVLDASIGLNSIEQVKAFKDSVKIDGIVLTKLDGTSKGGVIFPILKDLNIPVMFTGFGEKLDDLQIFDAKSFVENILF